MRRRVAIALIAGCAASAQAQRVVPIGATAQSVSVASSVAPLSSTPGHVVLSLSIASTSTIDHGRQGSVWMWVALGALVGGVVSGTVMEAKASHPDAWTAEYSVPLAVALEGLGGGVIGGLASRFSR